MLITNKFEMYEGEEYSLKFGPKHAKWDGLYKFIGLVILAEYDHWNEEHYVFRNSNGLTIIAMLTEDQWSVMVKNNDNDLCSSSEIYKANAEEGEEWIWASGVSCISVEVSCEEEEEEDE